MNHDGGSRLACLAFAALCWAVPVAAAVSEAVPLAADLKKSEADIRELFREEFKETAPDAKAALAEKLLEQAEKITDDLPAQYSLYALASETAAESGKIAVSMRALDRLAARFCISVLDLKLGVLEDASKIARAPEPLAELARAGLALAQEAAKADRFETALRAVDDAQRHARLARDANLQTETAQAAKRIRDSERAFQPVAEARDKLLLAPDHPDANGVAGRYYFAAGQMQRALILLSRCSDKAWNELAKADLADPKQPSARMELAERWTTTSEQLKDAELQAAKVRAAHWYRLALPGVAGLAKIKIEKRLQELNIPEETTAAPPHETQRSYVPGLPGEVKSARDSRVSPEEFRKLRELADAARLGDAAKRSEFHRLRMEYHHGLAANPEKWNEEEVKARVENEAELGRLYNRAMSLDYFSRMSVMDAWPRYVAVAPTTQEFLVRLRGATMLIRRYTVRNVIETTNERMRAAIDLYLQKNQALFPDKAKKYQFGEWLKQNGLDKQMLEAWQESL